MSEKFDKLSESLRTIKNLNSAASVLVWDQQVNMPPGGAESRAEQLATLNRLAHELFTQDEVGQLLDDLTGSFDYDSDEASLVRVAKRDFDRARKLSPELVTEMSRTFSLGEQVWMKARAEQDFSQFQETLTKIVDLTIQKAEAIGYNDSIYDPLLDEYEPGMTAAEVQTVFDELKAGLIPLVQAISQQAEAVDDACLRQPYNTDAQWEFGIEVAKAIGYDFERGRQDISAHPFSISFSPNDVRITTRLDADLFPSALFGTMHECGHAMYEQNVAQRLTGNPLANGTSLGVHESQSRLWENLLGRSREFWQFFYPRLQSYFPDQLGQVALETFYRAINKSAPSLIRVEADEVTYNLHIFVRFELEQALVTQKLAIADLPEAWNAKMEAYLGLTPPNDALGVLQDIHWSSGGIGYFPTYTLGNILSGQFYAQTLADLPDLPQQFNRGEFSPLLDWFSQNIHQHGRKYTAKELLERTTGQATISSTPYLNYITQKFSQLYEL